MTLNSHRSEAYRTFSVLKFMMDREEYAHGQLGAKAQEAVEIICDVDVKLQLAKHAATVEIVRNGVCYRMHYVVPLHCIEVQSNEVFQKYVEEVHPP